MLDIEIAKIYRFDGEGALKAFCDIIVSNTFLIKGLRILEGRNGLFVRMPARTGKDGKWYESIRPLSKEIRDALNDTILAAFNE
ncbi:MAG: SpoVG family protein [Candidatus Omnitrophica bacterium]|nr:SpoVG family protein [Candidatus Omnitrophota bacterium]